jgi:drug/metabolite transporter (DMT)-like permease
VQNLAGGLALVPFAFTLESIREVVPSWRLIVALGYCALLVSIIGYLLWFYRLNTSGATTASAYHFLMPPLGMLFGWLLISERIAFADLIGTVPVALGIFLVTRPAVRPRTRDVGKASDATRLNLRGSDDMSIADQNDLARTRVVTRITSPGK